MIERLVHKELQLATIIRSQFHKEGIEFFTDDDSSMQIGYMNREKDYAIQPHVHREVERKLTQTHEVLFIKKGLIRVDFYDDQQEYIQSTIVRQGDVILLADGGHGFKMLEPSEIIEVKQGPYVGELDKVRFDPIDDRSVKMAKKKD